MLLPVIGLIFLAFVSPAMASLPSDPMRQVVAPKTQAIFQLAQKEMPLPVLEVRTQPLHNGKWECIIEMSTEGQSWATKPFMNVTFEIPEKGVAGLIEPAIHAAAEVTKAFIEAAKKDFSLKEAHWLLVRPDRAAH
jgi:hypothetical protein